MSQLVSCEHLYWRVNLGRKKAFDGREKLGHAVALFHEKGYAATSTADLVERLEINRKSMYAEFGGKQEMFEAALELYYETWFPENFGFLETPTAGLAEIREVLARLREAARGDPAGYGCFLCNTAVERASSDEGSSTQVQRYIESISAAIQNAMGNAVTNGELPASIDIETEARFLTSHVLGQLTLIRANVAPDVVEAAADVAHQHLDNLVAAKGA